MSSHERDEKQPSQKMTQISRPPNDLLHVILFIVEKKAREKRESTRDRDMNVLILASHKSST